VQLRAGQIIGNTYRTVRVTGDLRKAGEPDERVTAATSWRDALLPHRRRTGRAGARGGRPDPEPRERVDDELCARASACYDHKALWTLIPAIGQMCFFIPAAPIGKPLPGRQTRRSKQRITGSGRGHAIAPHPEHERADLVHLCTVIIGLSGPLSRAESAIRGAHTPERLSRCVTIGGQAIARDPPYCSVRQRLAASQPR
jgi:hypothetical protein